MWTQKIFNDDELKETAYALLRNDLGDYMWETSLDPKDIKQLRFNKCYWLDIFQAWCKYNEIRNSNVKNVGRKALWYNSKIKIEQ